MEGLPIWSEIVAQLGAVGAMVGVFVWFVFGSRKDNEKQREVMFEMISAKNKECYEERKELRDAHIAQMKEVTVGLSASIEKNTQAIDRLTDSLPMK